MLLVQCAEEASEVAKEISKCLRFGASEVYAPIGLSNAMRVVNELNDLWAMVGILQDEGVLPPEILHSDKILAKRKAVEEHLRYSRECGTLTP